MADNTTLPGTGETFATDEITDAGVADGAKVERIKLGFGVDGEYWDASGDTPLPVVIAGAFPGGFDPVPIAGTVEITGAAVPVTIGDPVGISGGTVTADLQVLGLGVSDSNPVPISAGAAVIPVSLATLPNLVVDGLAVDSGHPVPVSGTVGISSVLATTGGYLEATGGPVAAASTDIIASIDARGYRSMVVQLTGTYSGSIVIEGSNNGSAWFSLPIYDMSTLLFKSPVSSISSSHTASLWLVNITTRYVRVRTSTYSSGSGISAVAELYGHPIPLPFQHGTPAYTENVGSGALSAAKNSSLTADGDTFSGVSTGLLATVATRVYNSVSAGWDRLRTASSVHGTTGTGLLGVGELRFDGTNYRRVRSSVATSAHTAVAASATSVSLLAANSAREMATFYNDSASAYCYLKLGATASATSFTYKMAPGAYYELPKPVWAGAVDGIWDAAVGSMRIGEFT